MRRPGAVRRRALWWAGLSVILLAMAVSSWGVAMDRLSADLVPFVSERAASLVLLRVTGVTVGGDRREREQGQLAGEVVEVFRSDRLKVGDTIEIPFERTADPIARKRQGFDHWNVLPLRDGQMVIFALRPLDPPRRWSGLAASAVDSAGAPDVVALREAVRLESTPATPEQRRDLLRGALGKGQPLLLLYAIDALGRRRALDRVTAIGVMADALGAANAPPTVRDAIVESLTRNYFFESRLGVEPGNVAIVGALAAELIHESNVKRRAQLLRLLASCVLGTFSPEPARDRAVRTGLVKAAQTPPSPEVSRVLAELAGQGPEAQQKMAARLLDVWKTAHAASP